MPAPALSHVVLSKRLGGLTQSLAHAHESTPRRGGTRGHHTGCAHVIAMMSRASAGSARAIS
eukprot:scaffold13829_cov35-Tisochrysis_lutea.AAC.1